jgi:fatty acid-binding protein DegV
MDEFKKELDQNAEYEVIYFAYGPLKNDFANLVKHYSADALETKLGAAIMAHTGPEMYGIGYKKRG